MAAAIHQDWKHDREPHEAYRFVIRRVNPPGCRLIQELGMGLAEQLPLFKQQRLERKLYEMS